MNVDNNLNQENLTKAESPTSKILLGFSLIFYALFGWYQWWAGVMPRLIRDSEERNAIHHSHINVGSFLFVILALAFIVWLFRPGSKPLARIKNAFANASNATVSIFFITAFFTTLYGLAFAWAQNEEIAVLGMFKLPKIFNASFATAGYMHASLGPICTILFSCIVFIYLYKYLKKYVHPLLAVVILLGVHVLVNLPKPPSLHPIANISTYGLYPFFYLCAVAVYTWGHNKKLVYWPALLAFCLFFLYMPYMAFKIPPPWHFSSGDKVETIAPKKEMAALRTKQEIFPEQASLSAAMETASWCTQCHNMEPSSSHLLGPNLVGVYQRQIASVEGYDRYSQGFRDKGNAGVYWTRETLSEFLTDGQNYIPGNLMNQQTDLSDPDKLNQVLDYIEYISTKE